MSLKFFMCWTDSDPVYQAYIPETNVLVSLSHIPLSWNINRFPIMPQSLMIDSGAFNLIGNPNKSFNQSKTFQTQLNVSHGSTIPTLICHLDFPIPPNITDKVEVYRRVETTLANAYEFMHLYKSSNLPANFKSVGVIQGNNHETIRYCAREMSRIGFDHLAIGSLASLYVADQIVERVRAAVKVVGPELHVFGISGIEVAKELFKLGISSIDSSRPMKASMYQCLLYFNPFRTFKIGHSNIQRNMPSLDAPLPCDCPICKKDPNLVFKVGAKSHNNLRAVHNYYHLKLELESIYAQTN
ncbi:MAG TPA: hypothetical protein VFC84_16860 [Desulfosporosinus sp.]|nr:hypothetical protein [Desulfosporosinus sp.]